MASLSAETMEAFRNIETIRAQAQTEHDKDNLDEAMSLYGKCARALVAQLETDSCPEAYKNNIEEAIKMVFQKMHQIVKHTNKNKEEKFSNLALNEKVKKDLMLFLEVIQGSIEHNLPYDDSSLMLYGPAGTGKTHIAEAIATQLGAPFIVVKPAEARSKWSGESEKYIRDIFIRAKKEHAVLFFDELHKLIRSENGQESSTNADMENQFLQEMNTRDKNFLIIAATSQPWDLAETVRRRFQECTYIPIPNLKERGELLNNIIENKMPRFSSMVTKDDIMELAEEMEGYSPDECRKVISLAFRYAIGAMIGSKYFTKVKFWKSLKTYYVACKEEHPRAKKLTSKDCRGQCNPVLTVKYLKKALKEIKPRIKEEDINKFNAYENAL